MESGVHSSLHQNSSLHKQRQAVNAIPKYDSQEITNFRKFMGEKLNLYQVLNFMFRVHS